MDVAGLSALEGGQVWIQVGEFDCREYPENVVSRVSVRNAGDVLHVLGAEPARHDRSVHMSVHCFCRITMAKLRDQIEQLDVSNNDITLPAEIHRDVNSIMWILATRH